MDNSELDAELGASVVVVGFVTGIDAVDSPSVDVVDFPSVDVVDSPSVDVVDCPSVDVVDSTSSLLASFRNSYNGSKYSVNALPVIASSPVIIFRVSFQ